MFTMKMVGDKAVFIDSPMKEYKPIAGHITESYGGVSKLSNVDMLVVSYQNEVITIEPHFINTTFVVIKVVLLDSVSLSEGMFHVSSIKFCGESLDNFYRQFVGDMNKQMMLKAKALGNFDEVAQFTATRDYLNSYGVNVSFQERKTAAGIKYFAANFKPIKHKQADIVSYAFSQI